MYPIMKSRQKQKYNKINTIKSDKDSEKCINTYRSYKKRNNEKK